MIKKDRTGIKKRFSKLYVTENLRYGLVHNWYDVLDSGGHFIRQFRRYGDAQRFALREADEAYAGRPTGNHTRLHR